jgi:hypothetical protein
LVEDTDIWTNIVNRYEGMFDCGLGSVCVWLCLCVCNSLCLDDDMVPHNLRARLSTPSSSSPIFSHFRQPNASNVISTTRLRSDSDSDESDGEAEEVTRTVITKKRLH